jgi:SAM-dependent methyltransferase
MPNIQTPEKNETKPIVANGAGAQPASRHFNRMEPLYWVPHNTASLLDVGCNAGELLKDCRQYFPGMQLSGIDINHSAVERAKLTVPDAEIQQGYGFQLPFPEGRFDCVTCIEVIEHVPEPDRPALLSEIHRVLAPGGRLVLRCPHAGIFSWLDAQNFRFRFPRLYRRSVGAGSRDGYYEKAQEELVWHHHFTREELLAVAGTGWEIEACRFGGLLLFPISDILRWPFYRLKRKDNWLVKALERVAGLELAMNFGKSSYGIMLVLKKT